MKKNATRFLDHTDSIRKIERLAWQIYEDHSNCEQIILVGIADRGAKLADKIQSELKRISDLKIIQGVLTLDKQQPLQKEISLSFDSNLFVGNSIVLVDDVLNSGKTLAYAVRSIMAHDIQSLKTCVLVDREHHSFPVKADYVGISLSTTIQEHVSVQIGDKEVSAYLS